jgi:hypothetical protein
MRSITRIVALFLVSIAVSLVETASAQSVLDPTDPVVNYDPNTPPAEPAWGQIGKWVRTPRMSWNTDSYKSYIYKGVAFRLKFPKTYNPAANDGKKYPMLVFWHGLGEAGPITDNEYHLYHGPGYFGYNVDIGNFDGFVIAMQSQGFWGGGHYLYLKEIIDYMVENNKLDAFRVSTNGLSAGGAASWDFFLTHPTYSAASLPMSAVAIGYKDPEVIEKIKFTPVWNFHGGRDGSPAPNTVEQVNDAMLAAGGNFRNTTYPDLGHGVWDRAWQEPDFFPFLLRAYAANPWPLQGRTEFCPGDPISATMGLAPGFDQYEWRKDGVLIPGATSNTLTATAIGTYSARIRRGTVWSEWSRIPVTIKIKAPTVPPTIQVSGIASRVLPGLDGSTSVKLEVPEGYVSHVWQKVGDNTTLSTTRSVTVSAPGEYRVQVTERFGCSSEFSTPFTVVDANGPNKPDAAINLAVTTISKTSIRLDWSDNPTPQNNETAFEIYQSTTSGGPYKMVGIVGQDVRTFTATNLLANTKYFYKVRAVNNTGAAPASNEATKTTEADSQNPTAPLNLRITGITRTTVSLAWSPASDDVSVTRYEVFVNGQKSYSTDDTTLLVSNLQRARTYNFTVRAKDLANNVSPFSNQVTGQPLGSGLTYKHYIYTGTMDVLPNFANMTPIRTGVMPNVNIVDRYQDDFFGFLFEGFINIPVTGTYYFRTNSDDGSKLYLGQLDGTTSPYNFSGTPIVENDGLHGPQDRTSAPIFLQAGSYPIAIAYYDEGGGEYLSLAWRTPLTGDNFEVIPNSAFADAPIIEGTPPGKPTNLAASPVGYKRIDLSWNDNSNNETGFEIWRSQSPFSGFVPVGRTEANATTYVDSTLKPNNRYFYRIRAVGQWGESDFDKIGQGVEYAYYEQNGLSVLPDFNALTPVETGRTTNFKLGIENRPDNFQVKYSGTINIPANGMYTFYLASDDGSRLYIDGFSASNLVVDHDGIHAMTEKSGSRTLTKGEHTIYVTFFEVGGGEGLDVRVSAPGLAKQNIPDSWLGVYHANATTLAPTTAPTPPNNLIATAASSSSVTINWQDRSTTESNFEVYRSTSNNSTYLLLATVPANVTSFTDTSLFANAIYFYKVRAVNLGGNSTYTNEDSAKTHNTAPVIVDLPSRSARYGVSTSVTVRATDTDGDALTFTAQNLPAFASFTSNGDRTGTLTLNPSSAQQGVYSNIRIIVSDPNGGKDTTQFNLTVSDNYDPTINAITDHVIYENDLLSVPLVAQDLNGSGDVLTWSVLNAPGAVSIIPGGSYGTATLSIKPGYSQSGIYNVEVSVSDGKGGSARRQFQLTVNDKDPNTKVYVRFQASVAAGAPWNNVTAATATNFTDAQGLNTGIGITMQPNSWNAGAVGPQTGNNSGIYPDAVLKDFYYFGTWWLAPTADMVITGLDPNSKYDLSFYAGSIWDIAPDNGNTNYTVNGQTVSLYVQNNTQNTVSISNITPAANGTITVSMTKGPGASAGYLNAFVITSTFNDGTAPVTPASLTALYNAGQGVVLNWQDKSYNETGFQVHRATSASGPYTLVGTTSGPGTSTYTDATASGNTLYYYKVKAINAAGASGFTETVSIRTSNRVPQVQSISNIVLRTNETRTVNVSATDDTGDPLQLTASNLPQFVAFTDNGNGTGVLSVIPNAGSVGSYNGITITAKDGSDSSRSTTFNITVIDQNVTSVYINFTDGLNADKPWNNLAGWPNAGKQFSGLHDDADNASGIGVFLQDGFEGVSQTGARPQNGMEIYPDPVMRTGYFDGSTATRRIVITGLNPALRYNFVFFNSREDGINTLTNFTINGQTVSLDARYNINKTVQINGIAPTAGGEVVISVNKGAGATYAFLNALVIQGYNPATVDLMSPVNLVATKATRSTISLQWQDRSSDETGFELWRASSGGSYSLVTTTAANVTSYTDENLQADKSYYYIVRAKRNSTYSGYSSVATGRTYAYSIYMNFNSVYAAPNPWNNTNRIPQMGDKWLNLKDEAQVATSVGILQTGQWAGMYGAGQPTGNNSGVYPDNVMIESFGLYPGQSATLKVVGLNLNMKYDLTFFASAQAWGDVTVSYTVKGKSVLLNASFNTTGTVTMYDVTPDENGEVVVTVAPGTTTSEFGLLGAMVINARTPNAAAIPTPPTYVAPTTRITSQVMEEKATQAITAYPNPFQQGFTLVVPAKDKDRLNVTMFDVNGKLVYQKQFANLVEGQNNIRIQAEGVLKPGVYMVRTVIAGRMEEQMIKVIRQ